MKEKRKGRCQTVRVAIVGSRNSGFLVADDILRHIPSGASCVLSGGARGIDSLAREAANRAGIPIQEILPDYEKYGKSAPLVRNREIVKRADLVVAFWDFQSRGTASVIALCIAQGIPVNVVSLSADKTSINAQD